MKRILTVCVCLTLLIIMSGCSAGRSPEDIKNSGVLRVAMTVEYPPFKYTGADGEVTGIDVDIARKIADKMGVKLEIIETPFMDVLNNVKQGKADAGISCVSINASRMNDFTFSEPYFTTGLRAVARSDYKMVGTHVELRGHTIGIELETIAHQYLLDEGITTFKPALFEADAVKLLLDQEVELVLVDEPSGQAVVDASSGELKLLPGRVLEYSYGVIVKLGNDALAKEINNAFKEMKDSQELEKIFEQYLDT